MTSLWNFCACYSDVILWGNQRGYSEMSPVSFSVSAVGLRKMLCDIKSAPTIHWNIKLRCRVVNYAITKRSLKSHSVQNCLSPCPADGALLTESCLIFSAYLEQASGSQFSFCLQESELKIHTALWLYLPVHTQTTIARQRQTTWNRQIFIWTTLQNFLLFMIWKNAEGVEWNMKELSNIVSAKNVHFFMPAGIGIKWGFFSQLIHLHKFLD